MINPEGHPGNPVEPSGFSINNRSWQWLCIEDVHNRLPKNIHVLGKLILVASTDFSCTFPFMKKFFKCSISIDSIPANSFTHNLITSFI